MSRPCARRAAWQLIAQTARAPLVIVGARTDTGPESRADYHAASLLRRRAGERRAASRWPSAFGPWSTAIMIEVFEFHPEALVEAWEARRWYAERSPQAAEFLLAELDHARVSLWTVAAIGGIVPPHVPRIHPSVTIDNAGFS